MSQQLVHVGFGERDVTAGEDIARELPVAQDELAVAGVVGARAEAMGGARRRVDDEFAAVEATQQREQQPGRRRGAFGVRSRFREPPALARGNGALASERVIGSSSVQGEVAW